MTCFALDAVSSTCFSALILGSEAVVLDGSFFLGEDLAAGDDFAGVDFAGGVFFLPPSPGGFATATISLSPSLQFRIMDLTNCYWTSHKLI